MTKICPGPLVTTFTGEIPLDCGARDGLELTCPGGPGPYLKAPFYCAPCIEEKPKKNRSLGVATLLATTLGLTVWFVLRDPSDQRHPGEGGPAPHSQSSSKKETETLSGSQQPTRELDSGRNGLAPSQVPAPIAEEPSLQDAPEQTKASVDGCNYGALPWDDFNGLDMEALRVPKSVWEDKYRGYSKGDLAAAGARLGVEMQEMRERNFEAERAAGNAVIFEIQYTVDEVGNKHSVPSHLPKSGNTPFHSVMGHPKIEDHESYYEFIWLPPNEYPEVYLLESETQWLKNH